MKMQIKRTIKPTLWKSKKTTLLRFSIATIAVVMLLLIFGTATAAEDTYSDGWHIIGRQLCYYENNSRKTGNCAIDNISYYFTDDGILKHNGKVQIIKKHLSQYSIVTQYYYPDANNELAAGWLTISNNTYYFDPNEYYAWTGGKSIDGYIYVFNDEGVLLKNGWYKGMYGDENGRVVTGYQKIGKNYYLFDENGISKNGFHSINGKLHYFITSYSSNWSYPEAREWTYVQPNWYYFATDTGELVTGNATIYGRDYTFEDDGSLVLSEYTFLVFEDFISCLYQGQSVTGWIKVDGNTYYSYDMRMPVRNGYGFPPLLTGYQFVSKNGKDYGYFFFDTNGVMQRNQIINVEDKKYYFDNDGKQYVGWIDLNGDTYHFSPTMAIGMKRIKSVDDTFYYYFDAEGKLQRDRIIEDNGNLYYIDADGKRYTGWLEKDGYLYYFSPAAYVNCTRSLEKDGVKGRYIFDSQGRCAPEGQTESQQQQTQEPGDHAVTEQTTLKKTKISKVTATSKKIKIEWKKLSKNDQKKAKKIEIQISTDKSFKNKDAIITKTIKSNKASVSISGLKKGTRYFVRMRLITVTGSNKYVSPWSSTKKITTLKK